jgi:7-cyano-7-deazaguanine tRNA-ribosyltransferase
MRCLPSANAPGLILDACIRRLNSDVLNYLKCVEHLPASMLGMIRQKHSMSSILYPVVSLMTGTTPNGGGIWKYVLHASEHGLLRRNVPMLSQVLHFLDFSVSPKSLNQWRTKPLRQHYNGNLKTAYKVDYTGDIFMDSGGYTLMFDPDLDLSAFGMQRENLPEAVLSLQLDLGATFVTSLDFPIPPNLDDDEANRRQQMTLDSAIQSAKLIAERGAATKFYVPIHGSTPQHLADFVRTVIQQLKAEGLEKEVYGLALGSMVPRRKGGRFDEVIEFAKAARCSMPEHMRLHVFGVTGIMVPYLMAAGASSFDSSRYVQEARTLSYLNPQTKKCLSWKHLAAYPCSCQVCRDRDIDEDRKIMAGELIGRQKSEVYAAIALHNLEVDFDIVEEARNANDDQRLDAYVQSLPQRFPTLHLPRPDKLQIQESARKNLVRSHTRNDYDLRRRRWKPKKERKFALILPCSQEKPYTRSKSFRVVQSALRETIGEDNLQQVDIIFLSGLYGPVPEMHAEEEAVSTYDFLLHKKDTVGISEVSKRLSDFIKTHSNHYKQFIAYSTQPAYRKVLSLASAGYSQVHLLPNKGRMGRAAFYKTDNLVDLSQAIKSCFEMGETIDEIVF